MVLNYSKGRKTKKLSMNNQTYEKNASKKNHISNPEDPLDAVKYMKFLYGLCHPEQQYIYHQGADKALQAEYLKEYMKASLFNHKICMGSQARGEGLTDFSNDPCINLRTQMKLAVHNL
eukprot:6505352-Ditylum_brightwellii.AAC.2